MLLNVQRFSLKQSKNKSLFYRVERLRWKKKRRFKITAAILAAVTAITVNGIATVSADSGYDNCDVDRDGLVRVADQVAISKYLSGVYAVPNYNQLDTNQNLVVDYADVECITAKLLNKTYSGAFFSRAIDNTVNFPSVSGFTPNITASSTQERTYMRYSYTDHHLLSDYTLTPTIKELSSGVNARAVIGTDTRYVSSGPENTGLIHLSIGATGFIVGDHEIATAAHCVYTRGDVPYHWTSFDITTYNPDGTLSNTNLTPVEAHVPREFAYSDDDNTYDYALITVEEDLSDYVQFSLGTPYNVTAADYANVPIYVTGAPRDTTPENENRRLYSAEGRVMDRMSDNGYTSDEHVVMYYNVDTSGGNSGGPVYTITKNNSGGNISYTYTALAIHHGGVYQNWGSMITNYQLQFYKNNPNISY